LSHLLIQTYLNQLQDLRKISGTHRESVVREAFKDLLKGWGKQHDLVFIPEYKISSPTKETRFVDGALLHELRVPFGYWEAKDSQDDLDAEIEIKFKRGYPQDNIIFEDSTQAILIQHRNEVMRCAVTDVKSLEKLLTLFFAFERPEIADFRKAVVQFRTDLPSVLEALRGMIHQAYSTNPAFTDAARHFLQHAQQAINPRLNDADVREMLIQHILTEEIFSKVFDSEFHRDNNVARELYKLEATFFTGGLKKSTLKGLEPYYAAIRAAAAQIGHHHEKQTFLKVIYENFYKVYNAKAADRLGVVYTPNEIVRFMIEGTDWLCEQHFGKNLIDEDVEILDPATGTGTFICELLEHFRGQPKKLEHKYRQELHANEVAILPYYVANLNIEATYAAITGNYEEFPNLCFVDTLDNVGLHTQARNTTGDMFGRLSEENVVRIKRQNSKKISVIIGNPPYNANQANENDNNKNRDYPEVDARIKQTYIAESTAQKTKLYDMYARFFRWASDRLNENGVIAFVSNSSFIDSRTYDGFRKILTQEFNEIWMIDLKGNARTSGERRRQEGGNIFENKIRVGVAVWFCVKKKGATGCKLMYEVIADYQKAHDKISFLSVKPLWERKFERLKPDAKDNWINLTNNDFETLMPLASRETKEAKTSANERAIFKLASNGIVTARDEWMTDFSATTVKKKVSYFCKIFESEKIRWNRSLEAQVTDRKQRVFALRNFVSREIKWTEELEAHLYRGTKLKFESTKIRESLYRPFVKISTYYAKALTHRTYQQNRFFPIDAEWNNKAICFVSGNRLEFAAIATDRLPNYAVFSLDPAQCLSLYCYDEAGNRFNNITDWALTQFTQHYQKVIPSPYPSPSGRGRKRVHMREEDSSIKPNSDIKRQISKLDIFHYVYAVLHDPLYREKYALNLKREFPRIPLYSDFWQWAEWGKTLMELHIGYESITPYALQRRDVVDENAHTAGRAPKVFLKADKDHGRIVLDSETTLSGIPAAVWDYKLGNRSAVEWILDQYKESKPKDPTIREKFDNYHFRDHKEKVIDLLMRVATVSVETQTIIQAMKALPRDTEHGSI